MAMSTTLSARLSERPCASFHVPSSNNLIGHNEYLQSSPAKAIGLELLKVDTR